MLPACLLLAGMLLLLLPLVRHPWRRSCPTAPQPQPQPYPNTAPHQSAHILGYLCLDGEGTKTDAGAALRWFRLAQRAGCAEAGRMIGSLLNTGGWLGGWAGVRLRL